MLLTLMLFIIAISILPAFDWNHSPPTFNPMPMFLGMILAIIVFVASTAAKMSRMRPVRHVAAAPRQMHCCAPTAAASFRKGMADHSLRKRQPAGSSPTQEGYSSTGSRLAKRSLATRSARDWNAVSTFSPVFALEK